MEQTDSPRPLQVPFHFCGRWIAWNHERTVIVADGSTLSEAREAAKLVGESRPFLTKAPDANVRFVGGIR